MKIRIPKSIILLSIVSFFSSIFLLSKYQGGDQFYYNFLYSSLKDINLLKLLLGKAFEISRIEPLSGLILWLGSNLGIDKNLYISILNVVLVCSLYTFLKRNFVSWPFIFLLLTNYYFVVLLTAAERLKISYLCIFLALIVISKKKSAFLFLITPLAHLQSFLYFPSVYIITNISKKFPIFLKDYLVSRKSIYLFFSSIILVLILLFFLRDPIFFKMETYFGMRFQISVFFRIIAIHAILIFLSKRKYLSFFVMLPFYPMIFFLGDERINMLVFSIFVYILIAEKRLHGFLVFLILSYFSIKTIFFIKKIIIYGNGFYNN